MCIKTLKGHKDFVWFASFNPYGTNMVVSASNDKTIKIWDITNGECIKTLQGHKDIVRSALFSPDGNSILSASYDKTIKLWEIE